MHSFCQPITVGAYIYMDVSAYWSDCTLCLCLCVCVISNQSTNKKPRYVSDVSRYDTLFHETDSKVLLVLRYQGSACVRHYSRN